MAAITYTANDRAPLIQDSPAHVGGSPYSFDVKLQAFDTNIELPKTQHVALSGAVETVLRRSTDAFQVSLIFPDSELAQIREFIYSVAAGESFTLDAFGSVAVPDDPVALKMGGQSVPEIKIMQGETPWRTVAFGARPA